MRRAIFFGLFLMMIVLLLLTGTQPVAQASGDVTPVPPGATPTLSGTPTPAALHSQAVLLNGDFEGGLLGWTTWQEDTGKPAHAENLNYALPPVFGIERNPEIIQSGSAALHIGRMYDPWHAGLKQVMQVTPGARVRFCATGRVYASNRDFGHEPSWAALDGKLKVGVAPGDAAWTADNVVWSDPANPHDEWLALCVEGAADDAGRVTVFTSADFRGVAAKHLDVWWDTASLMTDAPNPVAPFTTASVTETGTNPVSVWLLLPTGPVGHQPGDQSAYRAVPAQLYVGAVVTLAFQQPVTSTPSSKIMTGMASIPTVVATTTTRSLSTTPTPLTPATPSPTNTRLPVSIPSPSFTGTATELPVDPDLPSVDVRPEPTVTPIVIATSTQQRPEATQAATVSVGTLITLEPNGDTPHRSTALPAAEGLLGFGVLLVLGVGGGLLLLTRKR